MHRLVIILTMIGMTFADEKRAPSFFTAMRGKKSYQVQDYINFNDNYPFMNDLVPESTNDNNLIINHKRNPFSSDYLEHKGIEI